MPRLQCDVCSKWIKISDRRGKNVFDHFLRRHLPPAQRRSCDHCDKLFVSHLELWSHILYHHLLHVSGDQMLICDECVSRFKFRSTLRYHICLLHLATYGSTMECDDCGWTHSGMKSTLVSHILLEHHGLVANRCAVCPLVFRSLQGLENHVRVIHEGVHYVCDLCDMPVGLKPNLRRHHFSVHVNRCSVCTEEFRNSEKLTAHFKARHEGPKYVCDFCDKVINFKNSVYPHYLAKHVGSK